MSVAARLSAPALRPETAEAGSEAREAMVEARSLARTFRTRAGLIHAVAGVDFRVRRGEIVGFLGPNGAGKTTTQRMLATLIAPTSGEATIAGCDLRRDPGGVRRCIGYVQQGGSTSPDALVQDELIFQARLYGLSAATARRRAREILALLGLHDTSGRQTKTLSGGQRRRLDIALGLVHGPSVIFLDEPSTGLDPQARANLWGHVRRLRDDLHATIFVTTHYLDEADALCDRIFIIDHGRIVAAGSPDELKRQVSGDLVIFSVGDEVERANAALERQPGVHEVTVVQRDGLVRVTVNVGLRAEDRVLPLMRSLDAAGVVVTSMQTARPTLDDVFLTLTGRSLRDSPADTVKGSIR